MSKFIASKADKSSDALPDVESAGVTNPAKTEKAKSKEVANAVLTEERCQDEESTPPEPESSESDAHPVSSDHESEESDSEIETKAVKRDKANGIKAISEPGLETDHEDESCPDESSESECGAYTRAEAGQIPYPGSRPSFRQNSSV